MVDAAEVLDLTASISKLQDEKQHQELIMQTNKIEELCELLDKLGRTGMCVGKKSLEKNSSQDSNVTAVTTQPIPPPTPVIVGTIAQIPAGKNAITKKKKKKESSSSSSRSSSSSSNETISINGGDSDPDSDSGVVVSSAHLSSTPPATPEHSSTDKVTVVTQPTAVQPASEAQRIPVTGIFQNVSQPSSMPWTMPTVRPVLPRMPSIRSWRSKIMDVASNKIRQFQWGWQRFPKIKNRNEEVRNRWTMVEEGNRQRNQQTHWYVERFAFGDEIFGPNALGFIPTFLPPEYEHFGPDLKSGKPLPKRLPIFVPQIQHDAHRILVLDDCQLANCKITGDRFHRVVHLNRPSPGADLIVTDAFNRVSQDSTQDFSYLAEYLCDISNAVLGLANSPKKELVVYHLTIKSKYKKFH